MGALHEVLAVEASLEAAMKVAVDETIKTFKGQENVFKGHHIETRPLLESDAAQAAAVAESETVLTQETVTGKLKEAARHWARHVNAVAQKELANTVAKADLIIDGTTLIENAPATLLLGLEAKMKNLRSTVAAAPTRDMAKEWVSVGADVYTSPPEKRMLIHKMERSEVVIQPTEHQPGQYRTYVEAVNVAERTVTHFSGMLTPSEKKTLLGNFDRTINACKAARCRANEQKTEDIKIGKALIEHLLGQD